QSTQPGLQRGSGALQRPAVELRQERLEAFGEVLVMQRANVLAVDPVQLLAIETGTAMLHSLKRELVDEIVKREDLALAAGVPSEQGEVVDHRLWQVALLAVQHEVRLGVLAL